MGQAAFQDLQAHLYDLIKMKDVSNLSGAVTPRMRSGRTLLRSVTSVTPTPAKKRAKGGSEI